VTHDSPRTLRRVRGAALTVEDYPKWRSISGQEIRDVQFFDHYLEDAPAPKWMTEGVAFLDKDAKRDPK
jgi:hypothetical protein